MLGWALNLGVAGGTAVEGSSGVRRLEQANIFEMEARRERRMLKEWALREDEEIVLIIGGIIDEL